MLLTCYQGAEYIPNCTKQSILYENVCAVCVPTATKREQIKEQDLNTGSPALYVGETSRSVMERSREIWRDYRSKKEDSHIYKHQLIAHRGEPAKFVMRVVGSQKTALAC